MPRLEDNSYASRSDRERERREKVTTGKVTIKKRSAGRKILDLFLSEKIDNVENYIKYNVIGPSVKSLVYDIFMSTLSMMFWGDARVGRSDRRDGSGRRSYDRYYDDRRSRDPRPRGARPAYDVERIVFETRDDARRVVNDLFDCLDMYRKVRVADYYSSAGVSPEGNWMTSSWGWYSLQGCEEYPTEDGWEIYLPKCERID